MKNVFNLVSRQTVLEECATFYAELLPWVSYCYGSHPLLWHPLGKITTECGVQQGDPLGPLLFSLALHKLVSSIDADDGCLDLLLQAWYLDDGVLAGSHPAVLRAVHLLEELDPVLGIHINLTKCEFFRRMGNTSFPPSVSSSLLPNLDILGAPIGDYLHCTHLEAILSSPPSQHALSRKLDSHLFHSVLMTCSPANKAHLFFLFCCSC